MSWTASGNSQQACIGAISSQIVMFGAPLDSTTAMDVQECLVTSRVSFASASVPHRREGDSDAYSLTADDRFVLDSVDGMSSVEELAMMLAMTETDVIRSLIRLAASQLVALDVSEEPSASMREQQLTADYEVQSLLDRLQEQEEAASTPSTLQITTPAAILALRDDQSSPPRFDIHSGERIVTGDAAAAPTSRPTAPVETTSEPPRPSLPPPRPTMPPPTATETPKSRISPETPRKTLDPSWWKGMGSIEEPDEGLTAREISHSGLSGLSHIPASGSGSRELKLPENPRPRDFDHTDRVDVDASSFTEQMIRPDEGFESTGKGSSKTPPSGLYPRQTFERPPGGFIGPGNEHGEERDTSEVEVIRQAETTTDVQAVVDVTQLPEETVQQSAPRVVDELAHTREGQSPLLPEAEPEEGWGDTGAVAIPHHDRGLWAEEPIAASLRHEVGRWSEDDARAISYYLRLIQTGTYYEIFGCTQQAELEAIEMSAAALKELLRLGQLAESGTKDGSEAVQNVERGMDRALEVLRRPESRAQYDAALAALAAFKL